MIWYWNETPYPIESIQQGDFIAEDEAMATAWGFAQSWLAGAGKFTLPTSGSTGTPKQITISRAQMQASARATAQALPLADCQNALLAIHAGYIGGKMMLVRALEYQLALTGIPPVGNPLAHLVGKGKLPFFDFMALVPAQLYNIAHETPDLLAYLNGCKAIILGGGYVSARIVEITQQIQAPIYHTYGMTETVSHIALRRLNGAGKVDYFQALEGIKLTVDAQNCLQICGEVTQNEWVKTNDIVELITENRFIWQGRADNILNTGGIKVQIEVLETKIQSLLTELGLSCALAIVGLQDEKWQERIVLFLETPALPAQTEEKLWTLLRTTLYSHEVPKQITYQSSFPRTETGKIKREGWKGDKGNGKTGGRGNG